MATARVTNKRRKTVEGKQGAVMGVTNLTAPIYERQRQESFLQFGRFQLYRDLGPTRSQKQVAAEVGITHDQMSDVALRWRWNERASAWDKHLDEIKVKAIEEASRTMASRQAKLGMMLQDKAVVALENLNPEEYTVRDVVQLADTGVKIERLARGEQVADTPQVIVQLPSLPGWAKASKFIQPIQQEQDPES